MNGGRWRAVQGARRAIGRREVLRLAALSPLGAIVGSGCSEASGSWTSATGLADGFGPFPCRPTATSMGLWAEDLRHGLSTATAIASDGSRVESTFTPIGDRLALAEFTGLEPDTDYAFEVSGRRGGRFRTMPLRDGIVRLAFGSDIHVDSKPYRGFEAMRATSPHLYVGLGDAVYADFDAEVIADPSYDAHDRLYRVTWRDEHLLRAFSEVPSLLVWDDHEVWNDYDGSFAFDRIDAARAAYERFQHSRSPGGTAWSTIDAGPASVFVLDTRSFRSPNATPDGPAKSMLGAAQKQALFDWLAETPDTFRIIASPTAFHPYSDTGADSWIGGFATERAELLAAFAANDPARLAIVSGDLHWPAVVELPLPGGSKIVEYGCTPIAAFPRKAPASVGTDVLYLGADVHGFGLLTIDGLDLSTDFRFIDSNSDERFALVR